VPIKWNPNPRYETVKETSDGSSQYTLEKKVPPGKIWKVIAVQAFNNSDKFYKANIYVRHDATNDQVLAVGVVPSDIWWTGEIYTRGSVRALFIDSNNGDDLQMRITFFEGVFK
jgi:hypothetical protein